MNLPFLPHPTLHLVFPLAPSVRIAAMPLWVSAVGVVVCILLLFKLMPPFDGRNDDDWK